VQFSCKTEEAKTWSHVYRSRVKLTGESHPIVPSTGRFWV
jgi:hypothetical protein